MDKLESSYSIQHLYTSTTQPQQQQWKIKPYILLLCASTIQRQICKLTVKTDCENCNQFFFVFIANLVILYHWCNWMVLFRVVLVRIGLRKMLTVSRSLSHTIYIALCAYRYDVCYVLVHSWCFFLLFIYFNWITKIHEICSWKCHSFIFTSNKYNQFAKQNLCVLSAYTNLF